MLFCSCPFVEDTCQFRGSATTCSAMRRCHEAPLLAVALLAALLVLETALPGVAATAAQITLVAPCFTRRRSFGGRRA